MNGVLALPKLSGRQPADDRSRSTTAYQRLLDALGEHGSTVKANGVSATAQCPAHDDRDPSLSVRKIEDSVLLHCHAGCQAVETQGHGTDCREAS